jgi:hypothetical protein
MRTTICISLMLAMAMGTSVQAAEKAQEQLPAVNKCQDSFGSIALTDGDTQAWNEMGLGSPRELLAAVVAESGCFTMHSVASGMPANFLMTAVAGSKEEVDKTVETAKGAAIQGLARSGALSRMGGGAFGALGALGGLGGKKKTINAGLRVLSPATGMTVASGSAESVKTNITFGGAGGWGWAGSAAGGLGQYTGSKAGIQLATAFIKAYNMVVSQSAALSAVPKYAAPAAAAAPAAPALITAAVDTQLYAKPMKGAAVRALRAGTTLTPTGKREGLFVEAKDNFGTTGWASVEDMK